MQGCRFFFQEKKLYCISNNNIICSLIALLFIYSLSTGYSHLQLLYYTRCYSDVEGGYFTFRDCMLFTLYTSCMEELVSLELNNKK